LLIGWVFGCLNQSQIRNSVAILRLARGTNQLILFISLTEWLSSPGKRSNEVVVAAECLWLPVASEVYLGGTSKNHPKRSKGQSLQDHLLQMMKKGLHRECWWLLVT